jgi:hypothetical protein
LRGGSVKVGRATTSTSLAVSQIKRVTICETAKRSPRGLRELPSPIHHTADPSPQPSPHWQRFSPSA